MAPAITGQDLTATRALVCIGGGKKERWTKSLPGLARTINGRNFNYVSGGDTMTNEEFIKHYETVVQQERETLSAKRTEYANGEDRFANFCEGAVFTGLSPEQTLWSYMAKHLVSVREIVNGKNVTNEMLREKIGDVRNYLILLEGMIIDRKNKWQPYDKLVEKWRSCIRENDTSASSAKEDTPVYRDYP